MEGRERLRKTKAKTLRKEEEEKNKNEQRGRGRRELPEPYIPKTVKHQEKVRNKMVLRILSEEGQGDPAKFR